jgi:hypothetical protein
VSDEVRQRLIELATIDRWNQRFAREEQNAEGYRESVGGGSFCLS